MNKYAQIRPVRSQRRLGFTLVELLVVIGIIALLISVLLPTLGKAREQANITKCLANLQQMGLGLEMYNQLSKGAQPLAMERFFSNPANPLFVGAGRGRTWAGLLRDVAKVPTYVFNCPSDKRDFQLDNNGLLVPLSAESGLGSTYLNNTLFVYSYGTPFAGYSSTSPTPRRVCWSMSPADANYVKYTGALKRVQIRQSSRVQLVWDAYVPWLSNGTSWSALESGLVAQAEVDNGTARLNLWRHTRDARDVRHGPNCLFADCHAEARIDITNLTSDDVSLPPP